MKCPNCQSRKIRNSRVRGRIKNARGRSSKTVIEEENVHYHCKECDRSFRLFLY